MNRFAGNTRLTLAAVLMVGAVVAVASTPAEARSRKAKAYRPAVAATSTVPRIVSPTSELVLSIGRGRIVNLAGDAGFVWSSNPKVASVIVSPDSPRQVQILAVDTGEANIYAKSRSGTILYAGAVRVGRNVNQLDQMLKLAMPDASITATSMNGLVLLTGTVGAPDDSAEAERLVKAYVGEGTEVLSRLRTATPLQVNLRVTIAEVSRSLSKEIGLNILTQDTTGGFRFGVAQGRPGAVTQNPTTGDGTFTTIPGSTSTTLGLFGRLFGLNVASALDLAETQGLVTVLAEPNLTALSGETASFLAGGEFPIPISQTLGQVTIEYKQYGVSLAFTPTVLADGRISMRVRPEVSQLSNQGAVTLNGFTIPALTTRRAETTVELGSGQSFMIGGLLQNNNQNSIRKAPGLGDVPVLGSLFRSTAYQRAQTELMIVVTPYLVKPVNGNDIALPTDGLRTPNDLQTFLLGQDFKGTSGAQRPKPTMAPPVTVPAPSVGSVMPPAAAATVRPPVQTSRAASGAVAPGFSN